MKGKSKTEPVVDKEGKTADGRVVAPRKRMRRSPLRKTLSKLRDLEPAALKLIEKSVNEESPDKEALATSRWVITNLMTLTKAASSEEDVINGMRLKMDAAQYGDSPEEEPEEEEEEVETKARFSLHILPTKKDLEN